MEPRAVQLGHWLEATPTAVGIPQSNPRRSNPPGGAARFHSASRLWGTGLGPVPHDAPAGREGLPTLARSNVGEPQAWLDAPPVQGDCRTTGRMRAITCDRMPHGVPKVNANVSLATTGLTVEGSPGEGLKSTPWGGAFSCGLPCRVRTSATERDVSSNTDDDLVRSNGRRTHRHAFWEESRGILSRCGPKTIRTCRHGANHADPTNTTGRRIGAQPARSRRGLEGVGACAVGERAAGVSHQAARPSGFSNSHAGIPVKASSLIASSGEGL